MNETEKQLEAEVDRLKKENEFFRALLQEVGQHLIDVAGDGWLCQVCGNTAPMEVSSEEFQHKDTCPLHKPA